MFKREPIGGSSLRNTAWFDRFFAVPGLLLTSSICYALLGFSLRGYRGSEDVLAWTRNSRTQITIAVQVLSQILGFIHVHVLCTLFKNAFMLWATSHTFPIYLTQFVSTAASSRMTWALPRSLCTVLLLIVLSSFVPAPIWAASMSPLPANRTVDRLLVIPTFETSDLSKMWNGNSSISTTKGSNDTEQQNTRWEVPQGIFSFDMQWFRGALFQSASEASMNSKTGNPHAKLDKTGFSYIGRSFGTGAVSGFESFEGIQSPLSYTYDETGLKCEVKCIYNSSISDSLKWQKIESGNVGQLSQLQGYDTYNRPRYYTYYSHFDRDFFGWLNGVHPNNNSHILSFSIASTTIDDPRGFNALNNIQCNFSYTPDVFSLSVDKSQQTIVSTPQNRTVGLELPYNQTLIFWVNQWMWMFTRSDSCVDGSQIARALVANSDRLRNSTTLSKPDATLRATEDFLESLVDNINLLWVTTRMVSHATDPMINGSREGIKQVLASVKVPSVVFGEPSFIITIAVLNTVIVLAYFIEMARTRVWAGLPPVDLANMSDMVISAARGGIVVKEKEQSKDTNSRARKVSPWTYSQSEPFTDRTRIYMKPDLNGANMPAFVPLIGESERVVPSDNDFELQLPRGGAISKSGAQYTHIERTQFEDSEVDLNEAVKWN